jgi:diguanylate cyclase (GGDEF)-like protein
MSAEQGLEQLQTDYVAMLRALLPGVRDACYFGPDGQVVWQTAGEGETVPPGPGRAAVDELLADATGGAARRLASGPDEALFLLPVGSDRGQGLGVLACRATGTSATLAATECALRLRPVIRTMCRELSLRLRLLDGIRKLNVQAAEEQLLLHVESLGHARGECKRLAANVLALCRRYLQVECAALVVPSKGIEVVQGDAISPVEAGLLLADVRERQDAEEVVVIQRGPDLLAVTIQSHRSEPEGVLVLAGWSDSPFSHGRRSRIARYIASHIESLLDRDYDALTGLPTWKVFEGWLTAALADGDGERHTVMVLDVDQLHVANDRLGRETGDEIIRHLAALMAEELKDFHITRITGDSFAALLPDTPAEKALPLAEAIRERLSRMELRKGDQSFRPSVSIGIGPLLLQEEAGGDALGTAHVACKAAKDRGRGRVEVYRPDDISIVQRLDDIQLVGYVRHAIDRGRLVLLGQPIVPARAGLARPYFEVLVRLLDDEDRRISPAEFFSAAERYQLMADLDRWVVAETLRLIAPLRSSRGPDAPRFAINLSGQSLGAGDFLPFLQDQIRASGVSPDMLSFEITETVAVANLQRAQHLMHSLRRMGVHFSLDDFGTGLSSFAYLKLFPVDTLKIDGSFIRDLAANRVSQSVVAAIAEVARVMDLETVAEYVQDEATLAMLGSLGITWAQGYLLGEPELLADRIGELVSASTTTVLGREATVR